MFESVERHTTAQERRREIIALVIVAPAVVLLGALVYSSVAAGDAQKAFTEHMPEMQNVDLDPRILVQDGLEDLLGGHERVERHRVYRNGRELSWWGFVTASVYEPGAARPRLYSLEISDPFPGSILGIHPKDSLAQAIAVARRLEALGEGRCLCLFGQDGKPTENNWDFELAQTDRSAGQHWSLTWSIGEDGKVNRVTMTDSSVTLSRD
jgi:hypothetical protein